MKIFLIIFFFFLVFLNAQANQPKEIGLPVNSMRCPVKPNRQAKTNFYLDINGKRTYFCCQKCRLKFSENPDKYISRLPGLQEIEKEHRCQESNCESMENKFEFASIIAKRLHPVLVHFPIAFIFYAFFIEILSFFNFKFEGNLSASVRLPLLLSTLVGAIAALSGWIASFNQENYLEELAPILQRHRLNGVVVVILLIITTSLHEIYYRKGCTSSPWFHRLFMLLSLIAVTMAGYYGGLLAHGINNY